jgi:MinD-like ATPase involved in chromosome partitioning or flagellar assembly
MELKKLSPKTIVIHSSRGGTGKTLIATNLAIILAKKGFNVAFIDLDFSAPSLSTVFSKAIEEPIIYWMNDFFDGRCRPEDVLIDVSQEGLMKGKLMVGLANPYVLRIQSIMRKSRAWEVTAAKKLFSLISACYNDMKIDYCILDTSPGVQYSSVNAIVCSDLSITVTTMDSLDLRSTKELIDNLYDGLLKETNVLVNKFSNARLTESAAPDELIQTAQKILNHPVIEVIPCYCDMLQVDRTSILVMEKPNHQFVKKLEELFTKIETEKECLTEKAIQ